MQEQDPLSDFIGNLTSKIKLAKDHKNIMEAVKKNNTAELVEAQPDPFVNLLQKIGTVIKSKLPTAEPIALATEQETTAKIDPIVEIPDTSEPSAKPPETTNIANTEVIPSTNTEKNLDDEPIASLGQKIKDAIERAKTKALSKDQSLENKEHVNEDEVADEQIADYVTELEKIKDTGTVKQKEEANTTLKELKEYIDKTVKDYSRKILDLGGGGGSVAVQYAKGGTMDGDLNVNGHILSGGKNIADYFGGGGDPAVNALVHSNSGYWNTAYTNLVANSAAYLLSGTDVNLGNIPALSGNWNSTYTTVNTNSANWSQAYTNLTSNSAAYLSGVDISLLATTSASWNSVYTTVSANSASWFNQGTLRNYLSTNNVLLSSCTITNNLSVLGTVYSSATALVIAKYEKLIGDGVNTSFTINHNLNTNNIQVVVYDVGNNIVSYPSIQILNNNSVSIGFSFVPSLDFYRVLVFGTVPSNQINAYGQIYTFYTTATGFGDIPVLSANWNSNYTTTNNNSSFWSSAYTNLVTNSAAYLLSGTNVNLGQIPILSGNWSSAYTNLVTNSAAYLLSGINLNTVVDYLSTNNVLLSAATVTTNLNVAGYINANSLNIQGTGVPGLSSQSNINLAAAQRVVISTSPLRLYTATTSARNTNILVPLVGDIIYNTSLGTINFFNGSDWMDVAFNIPTSAINAWNSVYTSFNSNSAKYDSNWTATNTNSANWSQAYTNLFSNSAAYLSGVDISLLARTSASWNSVYTTVNTNSAGWQAAASGGVTQIVAGSNITISPAGGTGIVTINATGGGGGGSGYTYLNTDSNLLENSKYAVDTSMMVLTATLPAYAQAGYEIEIFDVAGTWNTNNLVVVSNGNNIEGQNDNLICNVQFGLIKLIYTSTSTGWRIIPMPVHDVGLTSSIRTEDGGFMLQEGISTAKILLETN